MEIIPFTSVGILTFGDTRAVVRQKLASTFSTLKKNFLTNVEPDAFDELGLHCYYTNEDRLEFVEAFDPAKVTFRGISFLGRDLEVVMQEMKSMGFEATEADVGVDFPEAGIALTAPQGIIEGVAAHRKGYYD